MCLFCPSLIDGSSYAAIILLKTSIHCRSDANRTQKESDMQKSFATFSAPFLLSFLAACGTYVPSVRDWPNEDNEQQMIGQIVRAVRCQLAESITGVIATDHDQAKSRTNGRRYTDAFDNWGMEANITVSATEKTGLGPSAILAPGNLASSIFTVSGSIGVSSEAEKSYALNTFYTMRQLYKNECIVKTTEKFGSPLVATDLGINALLESRLLAIRTGGASPLDEPGRQNVLSETVQFTVDTSGSLNPSWKLPRAIVNPGGNLFTTSRNRIHKLIITFGPLDRDRGGKSLIPIAEQTHIFAIAPRPAFYFR
jgi:hypothetical protein